MIHDYELDEIRRRDAERRATIKPGLKNAEHPDFLAIRELLQKYLSQPHINCGNVYADELADYLISNNLDYSQGS